MSKKPPREGARWGDDPAPELEPKPTAPAVPAEYLRLCSDYGEENVERALAIFQSVKRGYPQLPILKQGDLSFAGDVLQSSQKTMNKAAHDGRPHSMPETLKLIETCIGENLIQHPDILSIADATWSYGDEHLGKNAKDEEEKTIAAKALISIICALVAGGISLYNLGNLGEAFGVSVIMFGFMVVIFKFID